MLSFNNFKNRNIHPKKDDIGNYVEIEEPSTATNKESWHDANKTATTTPHDSKTVPDSLHDVKVQKVHPNAWKTAEHDSFDEPKMDSKNRKQSSGVVMLEPDHRVWVIHPTNEFGGYSATFPKGKLDTGLDLKTNAAKETYEETGLLPRITGHLGDFNRHESVARFYTGTRVAGHPSDMGWESQAVSLVPIKDLHKVVTHKNDKPIVDLLQKMHGYK